MESVGDTGAGEVVQREGRWRWRLVRGDRGRREKKEDEEVVEDTAGQGRGGSWYRGWRWRWQSQCPSARTGSRRVAANDPRHNSSLLCTERARERNARARAREGRQGDGKGAAGGRPTREEARGGQDSRWKADGRRRRRKGGNEMRSVFSSSVPPASARANARDTSRTR